MIIHFHRYKKMLPVVVAFLIIAAFSLVWFFGIETSAYAVYVDDQERMYVQSSEIVDDITKQIEQEFKDQYEREMKICNVIKYKEIRVNRNAITPDEEIKEALLQELEIKTSAAALKVDGEAIAYFEKAEMANQILEELKEQYAQVGENETLLEVGFEEDIEVVEAMVDADAILSQEEAYDLITTGTPDPQKYTVEEGDCLWLIARRNDMYVDDIIEANNLKIEDLKLGQELILEKRKPYISVLCRVEGEKIEKIPYETQIITDNSAPISIKVKQAGLDGERQIAYTATMINGTVEDREIIKEEIIKDPVNKILIKGTQVTHVASRGGSGAYGDLDWPVYGTLTQYYKGSAHTGIDIANRRGTPLKAADSGYVTFAGWRGGYGKFIIVDHGNGIVTRYGHCDSFVASVGQKVERGQTIALLGNTGNSTGPHVHFEVLVYGKFQNPLNYLQ